MKNLNTVIILVSAFLFAFCSGGMNGFINDSQDSSASSGSREITVHYPTSEETAQAIRQVASVKISPNNVITIPALPAPIPQISSEKCGDLIDNNNNGLIDEGCWSLNPNLPGDFDGDNVVTAKDISLTLLVAYGKTITPFGIDKLDFDKNGILDLNDTIEGTKLIGNRYTPVSAPINNLHGL